MPPTRSPNRSNSTAANFGEVLYFYRAEARLRFGDCRGHFLIVSLSRPITSNDTFLIIRRVAAWTFKKMPCWRSPNWKPILIEAFAILTADGEQGSSSTDFTMQPKVALRLALLHRYAGKGEASCRKTLKTRLSILPPVSPMRRTLRGAARFCVSRNASIPRRR
jgi:hypothetical protein